MARRTKTDKTVSAPTESQDVTIEFTGVVPGNSGMDAGKVASALRTIGNAMNMRDVTTKAT